MSYRVVWVLILVVLVGILSCGNDDDDNDGTSATDVNPVSGEWQFVGENPSDDSCDVDENTLGDPDGVFEIENHGDGTFTVTPNDDSGPFDCTLSGPNFDCPDRFSDEIEIKALDATVAIEATASGTFSSDTETSGVQTATISCEGKGCSMIETLGGLTFPCSYTQSFTATAK